MRIQLRTVVVAAAAAFALPACEKSTQNQSPPSSTGDGVAESRAGEGEAAGASRPRTPGKSADPSTSASDHSTPPADVAAPPASAQRTENGVFYRVLSPGKPGGARPAAADTVEVHYTGWTTDGKMFDSSRSRGQPASFQLQAVIKGWTEGLQVMTEGERTRFWIPEEMAYRRKPGAPKGMLVFDVELISVSKAPEAPPDVAAPPRNAKSTPKGVKYVVLEPGDGDREPRAWDQVKVHYTGWTTDGKMFDSSVQRGEPAEFGLGQVIPGWTDALQTMSVGQKSRLWIPEELAYAGRPGAPQGMLVFDVELLDVVEMPAPPPVPKDVAAPPRNAKKTDEGVFYRVLAPGSGTRKPTATDRVEVHYTGWTTDGKMFDSSVVRGKTAQFGLHQVIPGWTDGLQTMRVGGKTRFWIPEELAYKGKPGRPQGMLVFDVELVSIVGAD